MRRQRRDDLENSLNQGALWAVTYGDLMSYMMIFFLILFSLGMSKSKSLAGENKKYEEALVGIQKVFGGQGSSFDYKNDALKDKEESMVRQLRSALDDEQLSEYATVEAWDKKVRLVLADGVLFDSGKASLKNTARRLLNEVAAQLGPLKNPIVIEGHTDNVPIIGGRYRSNWELSMARAYAVLRFFENQGVASERLAGLGYGEHRPAAGNDTPQGRAKNRRIEIDIIRRD